MGDFSSRLTHVGYASWCIYARAYLYLRSYFTLVVVHSIIWFLFFFIPATLCWLCILSICWIMMMIALEWKKMQKKKCCGTLQIVCNLLDELRRIPCHVLCLLDILKCTINHYLNVLSGWFFFFYSLFFNTFILRWCKESYKYYFCGLLDKMSAMIRYAQLVELPMTEISQMSNSSGRRRTNQGKERKWVKRNTKLKHLR